MTAPSFSDSKLQTRIFPKAQAALLLQKPITLYFRQLDGCRAEVVATVEEIYQACIKELSKAMGRISSHLVGSGVASLFSAEEAADIDIHIDIDFTAKPLKDQIAQGCGLKWHLLKGIQQLIEVKLDQKSAACPAASDQIFFHEENNFLSNSSNLPFNMHTLRMGKCPIEFSCRVWVKSKPTDLRDYDFNAGELILDILSDDAVQISSRSGHLEQTLQELCVMQLTAFEPEKIEKKSLPRYFYKLLKGYHDPHVALLEKIVGAVLSQQSHLSYLESAKLCLQSVEEVCRKKEVNVHLFYLLISFLTTDHPVLNECVRLANIKLQDHLVGLSGEKAQFMAQCLADRKKPLLGWFLLMQAKKIEQVSHRGQPGLKMCLPQDLEGFVNAWPGSIILPIKLLEQLKEGPAPLFFLGSPVLLAEKMNLETRKTGGALMQKVCAGSELFPLFHALFEKFDLPKDTHYYQCASSWLREFKLVSHMPFSFMIDVIRSDLESGRSLPKSWIERLFDRGVPESCFEPGWPLLMLMTAIGNKDHLNTLHASYPKQVISFCEQFIHVVALKPSRPPALSKWALNLSYFMASHGQLKGLTCCEALELCHEMKTVEVALKLIAQSLNKSPDTLELSLQSLNRLAELSSAAMAQFLIDNSLFRNTLQPIISPLVMNILELSLQKHKALPVELLKKLCLEALDETGQRACHSLLLEYATRPDNTLAEQLLDSLIDDTRGLTKIKDATTLTVEELKYIFLRLKTPHVPDLSFSGWLSLLCRGIELSEREQVLHMLVEIAKKDSQLFVSLFLKLERISLKASLDIFIYLAQIDSINSQQEDVQSAICRLLDWLHNYLVDEEASFEEKLANGWLQLILAFQKYFVFSTLEHPAWTAFWQTLQKVNKHLLIHEYLFLDEYQDSLKCSAFDGPLGVLICSFEITYPFLVATAQTISKMPSHNQLQFLDYFFDLLEFAALDLWGMGGRCPFKDTDSANFVYRKIEELFFDISEESSDLEVNRLHYQARNARHVMNALKYCASMGDGALRLLVTNRLFVFPHASWMLELLAHTSGKKDLIILTCVEKALEEKALAEMMYLFERYQRFISLQGTGQSLLKPRYSLVHESIDVFIHRANLWLSRIKEHLAQPLTVPLNHEVYCLIDFFVKYLVDMSISLEQEVESYHQPPLKPDLQPWIEHLKLVKTEVCRVFTQFLELMARKKRFETLDLFVQVAEAGRYCFVENKEAVTSMLFQYVHEAFSAQAKKNDLSVLGTLLESMNACGVMLRCCEAPNKRVIDRQLIVQLLKSFRQCIISFPLEHISHPELLNIMAFFEGLLCREELVMYHAAWMRAIVQKDRECTYQELAFFAYLTLRLDANHNRIVTRGVHVEAFKDKFFIDEKFFSKLANIQSFLSIFRIAFSKYSDQISKEEDGLTLHDVGAFGLFTLYYAPIQNGIVNLKSKVDAAQLQNEFLSIIEKSLKGPKNRLTLPLLCAACNYVVWRDREGKYKLRPTLNGGIKEGCRWFYEILRQLNCLAPNQIQEANVPVGLLRAVFREHEKELAKYLSAEQLAEIKDFFTPRAVVFPFYLQTAPQGAKSDANK